MVEIWRGPRLCSDECVTINNKKQKEEKKYKRQVLPTSSAHQLLKRCPVSFRFPPPNLLHHSTWWLSLTTARKTRWVKFLTSISPQKLLVGFFFFFSFRLLLACKLVRIIGKQRNSSYCYFVIIVIISHRNCAWKSIPAVIFAIIVLLLLLLLLLRGKDGGIVSLFYFIVIFVCLISNRIGNVFLSDRIPRRVHDAIVLTGRRQPPVRAHQHPSGIHSSVGRVSPAIWQSRHSHGQVRRTDTPEMKAESSDKKTEREIPAGITHSSDWFILIENFLFIFRSFHFAGLAGLIASAASNWLYARSTSSRSTRKDSINATPPRRRPWPPARRTRASPRANREKSCSTVS